MGFSTRRSIKTRTVKVKSGPRSQMIQAAVKKSPGDFRGVKVDRKIGTVKLT